MTAKIAPLDMLDFVELGDPLSASEYNTLIQQVKARSVLSHPGYESPTGERVEKATPFFYPPVHGYASDADIPVYSVCSIDTGVTALKFIEGYSQTNVKAYVDGGFEFTNGGIYVKKDDPLYLQPIGFDTPIVLTYTGTAPIAGDEVGPVDAAFTVSKAGAGYVVINAPDTTNKLLWAIRAGLRKPLVRFTLDSALTTTQASKAATVAAGEQYGPGRDADDLSITVHNLLTKTASVYLFEGDSGDAGLAFWDSDQNYRIIQMECP